MQNFAVSSILASYLQDDQDTNFQNLGQLLIGKLHKSRHSLDLPSLLKSDLFSENSDKKSQIIQIPTKFMSNGKPNSIKSKTTSANKNSEDFDSLSSSNKTNTSVTTASTSKISTTTTSTSTIFSTSISTTRTTTIATTSSSTIKPRTIPNSSLIWPTTIPPYPLLNPNQPELKSTYFTYPNNFGSHWLSYSPLSVFQRKYSLSPFSIPTQNRQQLNQFSNYRNVIVPASTTLIRQSQRIFPKFPVYPNMFYPPTHNYFHG